jgi:biopolymer transport protein ExbB
LAAHAQEPAPGAAPAAAPATAKTDPTTGLPYTAPQSSIDANGYLVDTQSQTPVPRPPVVDIYTSTVSATAPRFDLTKKVLVEANGQPVKGAPAIDPATGALADKPDSKVIDPATGQLLATSSIVDPTTGNLIDPANLAPIPAGPVLDVATNLPFGGVTQIIDPKSGLPVALPAPKPAAPVEPPKSNANPYGPVALWQTGGIVPRVTLVLMALMLAATWYIIFTKLIEQTFLMRQAKRLGAFWSAPSVGEGIEKLPKNSPFREIANLADASRQEGRQGLGGRIAPSARTALDLTRTLDYLNARLQGGMAVLATVGSTAPFVGLFGTVVGIYNALINIGVSGEPSIEKVAGPVGEALIMTAIGLFVAVPAVFLYNVLGRRNKVVLDTARAFAADVDALINSGETTEHSHGDVRAFARG